MRMDMITDSFLPCGKRGKKAEESLDKPKRKRGQNRTTIFRQLHLMSLRGTLIAKRLFLKLCKFLLIPEGCDA